MKEMTTSLNIFASANFLLWLLTSFNDRDFLSYNITSFILPITSLTLFKNDADSCNLISPYFLNLLLFIRTNIEDKITNIITT